MTKVWFITGSSRGLGIALVEAVLKAGDKVIATARKPAQLHSLVSQYGADKILTIALDVTDNAQVLEAVKTGHEKFGRIDVVVNNAGWADVAAIEDVSIENFLAQINTNFFGVVYVTKAVLPILREQKSGHIIQISSVGGRVGKAGLSAYQSAKWAIGGFSTVLSQEVGPLGIKVSVIEPGGMPTDWAGSSMAVPPISEPYREALKFHTADRESLRKTFPSIPSKVAQILLKVSDLENPPLRLLIGPDAWEAAQSAAQGLLSSDEKWKELTMSST
jgi:NAD(P)-dependent dehydrogenase (short-subunit alcohol dehydrogenase family)